MHIARRQNNLWSDFTALTSQVHPVFMLPPLAASAFGAVLAGGFVLSLALVHLSAIFFAVYTAHVKDGYVDFYLRGEDDDHPLTASGCQIALIFSSTAFFAATALLWLLAGPGTVALTLPTWFIAYLHAPQLDTNPVTTTTGYPFGISLALLGGYYAQTGTLAVQPVAFAAILFVLLTGVKVIDDSTDYDYDQSVGKHTVAVVLGRDTAHRFAYGLMIVSMVSVVVLTLVSVFPSGAVVAVSAFAVVAVFASRANSSIATMLLVRGSYVFLAILVVAVWFHPLS